MKLLGIVTVVATEPLGSGIAGSTGSARVTTEELLSGRWNNKRIKSRFGRKSQPGLTGRQAGGSQSGDFRPVLIAIRDSLDSIFPRGNRLSFLQFE
ncbi:MAG: hypothetical protein IPH75_16420 [bacterium]|nr:hypothetical protein [bacterium]